jgi:DNA-binding response OmpR family regulator
MAALSGRDRHAAWPVGDILVMEDDPPVAEVLYEIVQRDGHTVDVAANGSEGLARLQHGRYRLLLLDLMMPVVDGFGVLQALRAEPALRPPAVVVLSALQTPANVMAALEAGADDYITKPFDMDDLAVRVNMWLRRVGPAPAINHLGLRVHSLGRFRVEHGGQIRLHEGGRARKAATLFKYLLSHQERTVAAGEVLALLWPHTSEELAAKNLRSLLYQLRQSLGLSAYGRSCLYHGGGTLALQLGPSDWWDVAEFTAWLSAGAQWQRVGETARALDAYATGVALYAGDYLAEDAYADWARPARERLREDWLRALTAMATLHGERGEHEQQEAMLRAVLRADPYREHSHRALMTLLATQGRGAEALVLYRRLETLLRAEFSASPASETQVLATRIARAAPLG